jgi:tetratricopeptide (TPR) repeat protein
MRFGGDEYNYYFYWSQQIKPLPDINYRYLADLYAKKKEYGQARYYFLKSLDKNHDAVIYYNLGVIDAGQGHMTQAKEEFLLSVNIDPHYSSAYNNLGVIYFNEGDYKSAKDAFLKTIQLNKYCIEARSNLGLISLMQSDFKGAINYYQANLDIVPNDKASLSGLAQAETGLKNREKTPGIK